MNSCRAFVTAAFFVRSPLTSSARSISLGSIDRFVAMCDYLHTQSHRSRACIQVAANQRIGVATPGGAALNLLVGCPRHRHSPPPAGHPGQQRALLVGNGTQWGCQAARPAPAEPAAGAVA